MPHKKPKSFEQRGGGSFGDDDGPVLRGRIIGLLDDGFVVKGESEVVEVFCEESKKEEFFGSVKAGSEKSFREEDDVGAARLGKRGKRDAHSAPTGAPCVAVGDIVEVWGARAPVLLADGTTEIRLLANGVKVLQPCEADFFVRPSDPNWLRGVVDQSVGERLRARAKIVRAVRQFFEKEGFLEVDTPSLVRLPGMEPYLDVFKTRFFPEKDNENEIKRGEAEEENLLNTNEVLGGSGLGGEDMYLITSPEYAMKKLLVSGERKIFQLAKVFRNKESGSRLHNPEFTLLEWYRAYSDYSKIMDDTEELVQFVWEKISGRDIGSGVDESGDGHVKWQGNEVDLSGPWPRKKVKELFEEYAGIPVPVFEDEQKLRAAAEKKGYGADSLKTYDDIFFAIFLNEIEPKLGFDTPVFVYEYPISMASLARPCAHDPAYAERFELYIAGVEMCNGFGELCDATEQRHRLERERLQRKNLKKDDYGVDQSFLSALEFGMPPSGGNALGIDRLVMLLLDAPDIQSVMAFPHKDL